jgi:hypothetical protein
MADPSPKARDHAKRRIPNGRGPVRRWTVAEDERLRELFGAVSAEQLSRMMGRTQIACAIRAARLNLGGVSAVTQGFERIQQAAVRHKYEWSVMKRIIAWAGLHAERISVYAAKRTKTNRKSMYYRTHSVDEAVEAWRNAETPGEAAKRTGVSGCTIRRWLRESGVPGDPSALAARLRLATEMRTGHALKSKQGRREWRVDKDIIDALVRERIRADTMMQGAARNGLTQQVVCRLLAEAKIPRIGKKWIVPEAQMNEICAGWWRKRLADQKRIETAAAALVARSTARLEKVRAKIREIEARLPAAESAEAAE